jgi:hypothetical protein
MRPTTITVSSLSDDANGIAEDQTTAGAGDLSLDGALVAGGIATMAEAQIVSIESTGSLAGVTFTVTGTDADGRNISEDVTGPNNSTVVTTQYYKTVTQIAVDGAVGTNTEVGPLKANGGVTKSIPSNWRSREGSIALVVSGTATVTVQQTYDDVQTSTAPTWFPNSGITTKTANTEGNHDYPVRGVRLSLASWTSGDVSVTYIQADD